MKNEFIKWINETFFRLMQIGFKIRTIRESKGITAKALAQDLKIDLSTLNRIENDKILSFKPEFLLQLAELLYISTSDLFEDMGPVAVQSRDVTEEASKLIALYEKNLEAKDKLIEALEQQIALLKTSNDRS